MGVRNRLLRLPVAVTGTGPGHWCLGGSPSLFARRTILRPLSQTTSQARIACSLEPRYSTETFPSDDASRPQVTQDIKPGQAALVFQPDAAQALDIPPEEAFHAKRSEEEVTQVVTANSDIIHDLQCGALTVDDSKGAEMLRKLDLLKSKEVLKRKFFEGPGSNQSSLEALNRSMVSIDQAKAKDQNRKYEDESRAYKQFITPPPKCIPSIWGPGLEVFIEKGTFCPFTGLRKPNVDLDSHTARGEYIKAKLSVVEKLHAFPPRLLTEVLQCLLDLHVAKDVPDDSGGHQVKLIPRRPRWPCCTTCSTCVMVRSVCMLADGRSMNPQKSQHGPRSRSRNGMQPALERRTHPRERERQTQEGQMGEPHPSHLFGTSPMAKDLGKTKGKEGHPSQSHQIGPPIGHSKILNGSLLSGLLPEEPVPRSMWQVSQWPVMNAQGWVQCLRQRSFS